MKDDPKTDIKKLKQGKLENFNIKISEKTKIEKVNDSNGVMIDMPDDARLKIVSWNINGLRAFKGKGTLEQLMKIGNKNF